MEADWTKLEVTVRSRAEERSITAKPLRASSTPKTNGVWITAIWLSEPGSSHRLHFLLAAEDVLTARRRRSSLHEVIELMFHRSPPTNPYGNRGRAAQHPAGQSKDSDSLRKSKLPCLYTNPSSLYLYLKNQMQIKAWQHLHQFFCFYIFLCVPACLPVYKTNVHTEQPRTIKTSPTFGTEFPLHTLCRAQLPSLCISVGFCRCVFWERLLVLQTTWHPRAGNKRWTLETTWLVSSPARGTYNSITRSLTANDIVPPIRGSLDQNGVHGRPVSAALRGGGVGWGGSTTSNDLQNLQNISILTKSLTLGTPNEPRASGGEVTVRWSALQLLKSAWEFIGSEVQARSLRHICCMKWYRRLFLEVSPSFRKAKWSGECLLQQKRLSQTSFTEQLLMMEKSLILGLNREILPFWSEPGPM